MTRLLFGAVLVAVVAMLIESLPEIERYLELRDM
ncbi:MAG: DUF6893 family small protein [Pseudonocardia sp.]